MLPRTYQGQECSIARALEVVGERWTLLIIRDALFGVRRFDDLKATVGIAPNVLTVRLEHLVESGLLRREPYCRRPLRVEYVPTERAIELWPVLLALGEWGARHGDRRGAASVFVHAECGTPLRAAALCRHCDVEVPFGDAVSVRQGAEHRVGQEQPALPPARR